MWGEALEFAILRDGVVFQFVVATRRPWRKLVGAEGLRTRWGAVTAARFPSDLSPFSRLTDKSLPKCLISPPLLAKKVCMWPRRKEEILLPSTCINLRNLLQGCAVRLVKKMETSQRTIVSHSGSDAHTLHRAASVRTMGTVESERTNVPSHMFHLKRQLLLRYSYFFSTQWHRLCITSFSDLLHKKLKQKNKTKQIFMQIMIFMKSSWFLNVSNQFNL